MKKLNFEVLIKGPPNKLFHSYRNISLQIDKSSLGCEPGFMMKGSKLPVSCVIIVKNEEQNITDCLRSASFAEEILVMDSGSTDRTCELARRAGAKVVHQDWLGFGPQKARATELAQFDWIINIDADERISSGLADEIADRWPTLDPQCGYLVPRKSFYLGKWIFHGGWYPDHQLRLYHRKFSHWDSAPIHEKVKSPSTRKLRSPLEHYVFINLQHQVETNNRYSSLQAQELHRRGIKFRWNYLLIKPWIKFVECFFWKRGFQDGLPGFVIAVGAAYSVFLKWAKLWELEREYRR
jgi:glycosyltransferase involved in cell wall biosynthesis